MQFVLRENMLDESYRSKDVIYVHSENKKQTEESLSTIFLKSYNFFAQKLNREKGGSQKLKLLDF